jgi:3-keto-L-gulonate-6-phosphate decarboxylase
MDDLVLIQKIQKLLKDNYNQVANVMVSGGVDSMDKYKYMLGQAQAYTFISGGNIQPAKQRSKEWYRRQRRNRHQS